MHLRVNGSTIDAKASVSDPSGKSKNSREFVVIEVQKDTEFTVNYQYQYLSKEF